jgi:hypothetical protein
VNTDLERRNGTTTISSDAPFLHLHLHLHLQWNGRKVNKLETSSATQRENGIGDGEGRRRGEAWGGVGRRGGHGTPTG